MEPCARDLVTDGGRPLGAATRVTFELGAHAIVRFEPVCGQNLLHVGVVTARSVLVDEAKDVVHLLSVRRTGVVVARGNRQQVGVAPFPTAAAPRIECGGRDGHDAGYEVALAAGEVSAGRMLRAGRHVRAHPAVVAHLSVG